MRSLTLCALVLVTVALLVVAVAMHGGRPPEVPSSRETTTESAAPAEVTVVEGPSRSPAPQASEEILPTAEDPSRAVPRTQQPLGNYSADGVRSFFFNLNAWEVDRVLASRTFNPRGSRLGEAAHSEVLSYCSRALQLIGPMKREMSSASLTELHRLASAGRAREGPRPTITKSAVDGAEVLDLSLTRPDVGDLQVGDGKSGRSYVATWAELPQTKQQRADVALTIMEHVIGLARLVQKHEMLTANEVDLAVSTVVETAYQYN